MKTFSVSSPRDAKRAATLAAQARREGRTAYFNSGGTDLLGMVKDRIVQPDLLINLRQTSGAGRISNVAGGGLNIPGQITLEALSADARIRRDYAVLAQAAETVATPQIRNFGTLAGNICQRPWCWYFRNGFPCYKAGGNQCFSVTGANQFHAIFGGGPSYIVHPSDTAPALVALDAHFRITGPTGDRSVPASEFFTLPRVNAERENVLKEDEAIASIMLPAPSAG